MNLQAELLPLEIYSTEQIRQFETMAINDYGITETTLMAQAAQAALNCLLALWPEAKHIGVVCGPGNNAGDGYYLAKLATEHGLTADVYYVSSPEQLTGAAKWAYGKARAANIQILPLEEIEIIEADILVDAIFGIGLDKPLKDEYFTAVERVNNSLIPVLSLDIPTGVCSKTGNVFGNAVIADATMTFIGVKSGLVTGKAVDYVGELFCDDLQLPVDLFLQTEPYALRLSYDMIMDYFEPRLKNSHKGDNGHVVIIGGDYGLAGAVSLAANAALRAGAGLVTVVTRAEHIAAIVGFRPEVMAIASEHVNWSQLLARADIVVVGPGLGQSKWSEQMFAQASNCDKSFVIDADGLHFLKKNKLDKPMIITPHPGEAASLLGADTASVQANRYDALTKLRQKYPQALAVLKGAGSLILDETETFVVCPAGNPGMSSAGMGDVLTGLIAGLWAQGYDRESALEMGVMIHALAGDLVAFEHGERGMLATDLLSIIQQLVNPDVQDSICE